MTEQEWNAASDPWEMLWFLEGHLAHWGKETTPPKVSDRKIRLFACACCRRIWDLLGDSSRNAVEVAERFADARASVEELHAARCAVQKSLDTQLPGFPHVFMHHGVRDLQLFLFPLGPDDQNWKARTDDDFEQVWGYDPVTLPSELVIYRGFTAAIDAASSSTWGRISTAGRGCCTLEASAAVMHARSGVPAEDLKLWYAARETEQAHMTLLLRHIVGNPFRPCSGQWPSTVVQLAEAVYSGQDCSFALYDALIEAGRLELADHFKQEEWHPKGCWALDLILAKK